MDADRLKQLGQNTRLLAAVTKDERNVLISSAASLKEKILVCSNL
jgi:hypothetical protein